MNEGGPEERLRAMGTHEMIADLKKKYGLATAVVPPAVTAEENTQRETPLYLRELVERKNAFMASLEGLPKEKWVIGHEELRQIREVASLVHSFLEKYESESRNVGKEDRHFYDKEKIAELITQLDGMNVWCAKFATECAGGARSDTPLQEYNEVEDSLYYMTPSGATMRLKMIELVGGLRRVIQPFTEKILFGGPDGEISEVPREGYSVQEYLSALFTKTISGRDVGAYQSDFEIYRRGNSVAAIAHKNERGQISFSPDHTGDRVNKVFFLKK